MMFLFAIVLTKGSHLKPSADILAHRQMQDSDRVVAILIDLNLKANFHSIEGKNILSINYSQLHVNN